MKRAAVVFAVLFVCAPRLDAQEPPPPIPLFVVDLHAVLPNFPSDSQQLANSRKLQPGGLPGLGFGGDLGVHLYPLRWRQVTFGIGGSATLSRAHSAGNATLAPPLPPVTERFTSIAPQLSFNFGTGSGWSYISGGIAGATWSIVADGVGPLPPDQQRLKTINYGGGARWFIKPHVAFSFDVRFYAIDPSAPTEGLQNGPRTTLLVVGAGISMK
jgi:hypothetical protein